MGKDVTINASARGNGDGGRVETTGRLILQDSQVRAATLASGNAGNVTVIACDRSSLYCVKRQEISSKILLRLLLSAFATPVASTGVPPATHWLAFARNKNIPLHRRNTATTLNRNK
ncbi:MAG: hypothetical protein VKL59_24135 [Nostocaceae cyanobacterium]|nr:hypothetical protein [Nostocaceae cyanobacterium]